VGRLTVNWGVVFIALLGMALTVLWLARRSRAATGLPVGRLVYADTTRWRAVERPLFSRPHHLTGRPDYLIQDGRDVIPVEVKSGRAPPDGPYPSHILQLAAYCLLVEEVYKRRPTYGVIVYADEADQGHEIDFTPELEESVLDILDAMRRALRKRDAPRDHDQVARCQTCSYRKACDQSLA
jgi:CRISPR-associated exonuclease Cas4